MPSRNDRIICTAAERDLLDMIACWPGVPAWVTIHEDGRYSVSTPEGWGKGDTLNTRAAASFAPELEAGAITHDRAQTAARRLIGSHFGLADRARITVPPRKEQEQDDDFVLMAYIRQQRGRDAIHNSGGNNDDAG